MIRSAVCFILSVSLHVAALAYPLSFGKPRQSEPIPATIFAMQQEARGADDQNSGGHRPAQARAQPFPRATSNLPPRAERQPADDARLLPALATNAVTAASDGTVGLISPLANTAPTGDGFLSDASFDSRFGANAGGFGSDGNPIGSPGAGSGQGNGNGAGASRNQMALTQARYRETPRPKYPESARRVGREGRVLLRVLVDEHGRPKQVEVNDSSGSKALDRAAAEAIQHWRFYPAQLADKPIESWLKVPIEFRLAETATR